MRRTATALLDVRAGCFVCHGKYEAGWFARNSLGVAARHHDSTGHPVWVEQVTGIWYGKEAEEEER